MHWKDRGQFAGGGSIGTRNAREPLPAARSASAAYHAQP